MTGYRGPERRSHDGLSDEQMEELANRAADKALAKVYAEVGKSIVHKIMWLVGVGAIALLMWMGKTGIKP